ncbi:GNAT family N-acetyltransferase [Kaistia sp. 32K]|uniref:GNAT family N-acetyltransferase n=1 Tax=Kaistia sp. 32K TaxID=2795690 RepID=UPI001FCFE68B|nr:GNAT family N-acetyltransferase [Kaistia sp. 32K]
MKAGYRGFPAWFASKAEEDVYIVDDDGRVSGMIYLKQEIGPILDVKPPLGSGKWLKVGTLKIEGRGTKLGERVLKKILDTAISEGQDGVYVTVFDIHADLIALFERYGFQRHATKATDDGVELVLARDLNTAVGDIIADYPFLHLNGRRSWLLAVYPQYHSRLLPDSILNNEPREIVQDVSHTNTIHKMYIGGVPLTRMSRGDMVVIYRTSDRPGHAYFRSVATSVCVVEEVRRRSDFLNVDDFVAYALRHSVYSEDELRDKYETSSRLYVVKMTYNVAFSRRTTRGRLMEEAGISEQPRWDLRELSDEQFGRILELGQVDARLVIH